MDRKFKLFTFGIFLVSLATLSFEVALAYEYAFMFWFYISFIVITIALFGIGIGSVAGYFLSKRYPERFFDILFKSSIGLAIGMIISIGLSALASRLISLDYSYTGMIGFSWDYLLLTSIVLGSAVIPFFFSGICLSTGLNYPSADKKTISYIYFADLAGAGIGSFIIITLLPFTSVEGIIVICSFIATGAAAIFSKKLFSKNLKILSLFLAILLVLSLNTSLLMPKPTNDKFLPRLQRDGAEIIYTQWTPISRLDIVEYPDSGKIRFIENAIYPITVTRGVIDSQSFKEDPRSLMFVGNPKNMVAIGSGGGVELTMAINASVERIDAVEINPLIIRYMKNELKDYSNRIYFNPKITTHIEDGRAFIHRSTDRYDLIENGVLGSSGIVVPSTSMLTFEDVYVYTVEANKDYWNSMSSNGITVTIIYGLLDEYNTIDADRGVTYFLLRQYYTVKKALEEVGVDASRHMMIFRYLEPADSLLAEAAQQEYTFIFKKELTPKKVETIINKAEGYGLKVLYAPYYKGSLDFDSILESLPSDRDVSPATDDRPFFYFVYKSPPTPLYIFAVILFVLTLVFIILPISVKQRIELRKVNFVLLFYFLFIGLGYILIEIVLIQKFILFLGNPVYAFQVVLFTMLVFSGIGSYMTGVFMKTRDDIAHKLVLILLILLLVIFSFSLLLSPFVYNFLHFKIWQRVLMTIGFLSPIAILMGMPFPLGLRITSAFDESNVIWMYGVNSCGSVIGAVIAMIFALKYGYSWTLFLGLTTYMFATLASIVLKNTSST